MSGSSLVDSRGYFCLNNSAEGDAYYRYGTPSGCASQYAHPRMLSFLFTLVNLWSDPANRRLGLGNISLKNGGAFPPHRTHRSGLEIDLRPLRKDGLEQPVHLNHVQYDREATALLVQLAYQTGYVDWVGFNDRSIPKVRPLAGHDDHLHIQLKVA